MNTLTDRIRLFLFRASHPPTILFRFALRRLRCKTAPWYEDNRASIFANQLCIISKYIGVANVLRKKKKFSEIPFHRVRSSSGTRLNRYFTSH